MLNMLIDDLPDDCLRIIFDLLNELDDLLNCYEVCKRWNNLIADRGRKVKCLAKYLIGQPNYSVGYVYYQTEESINESNLSKLFPNLMVIDCDYPLSEKVNDIVELVRNTKSLKGFIRTPGLYDVPENLDDLEYVFRDSVAPYGKEICSKTKQLYFDHYTIDYFKLSADHLQNLERLHISNNMGMSDNQYDGPVLKNLKIVELGLSSYFDVDICYGFQFMDSCPNLRSAHIKLDHDHLFVNESMKHIHLQDLVIDFIFSNGIQWGELKRLMKKYPNLKHLALRNNQRLKDKHIERLVNILSNLEIFDVRSCPKITEDAADYVQDYCVRNTNAKSIKFYFDKSFKHESIESYWSQSGRQEKVNVGFNFMKNCFFKYFDNLPQFLIPIDD